jgi:hypothetical protein
LNWVIAIDSYLTMTGIDDERFVFSLLIR